MAIKFEAMNSPRKLAEQEKGPASILPAGFADRIAERLGKVLKNLPPPEPIIKNGNGGGNSQDKKDLVESVVLGDIAAAKKLLDTGGDVNARDRGGWTLLMNAAQNGDIGMVELLVSRNALLDEVNPMGWTALMCAAVNGREDAIVFLLSSGAEAGIEDKFGHRASGIAMENGYAGLALILRDQEKKK